MATNTSPSIKLRFVNDNEIRNLNAEHAAKHRRCLFSGLRFASQYADLALLLTKPDAERRQMSDELIDAVVAQDQDPGQVMLDLEQDCLETYPKESQSFSVFRGPFGVARWLGSIEVQDKDSELIDFDAIGAAGNAEPDDDLTQLLLGTGAGSDIGNNEDMFADLLQVSPIRQTSPPRANEFFNDIDLGTSMSLDNHRMTFSINEDPKAWLLLSYYRDRIIRLISLRQQQQPQHDEVNDPWSSLVMPCAMTTMAELTIGASASHARLGLLNSLLATSAFHLQNSSTGFTADEWMVAGEEYTERARGHLEACLEMGKSKCKYKEVLMAILCLANTFMVKGDPDTRLTYLLYAERFIRANGFNKPTLSRKRRTLHHCYAYMRIMAETTRSSSYISSTASPGTDKGSEDDNDQFRVSRWTTLSENLMGSEKDPDTARRDLHLEVPGNWTSTLFPELYGIAESFLLLLSQVIRLANERDLAMDQDGDLSLKEFILLAKSLEKSIYRLISSSVCGSVSSPSSTSTSTSMADDNAMQATYTALLIFFYRRVHNVDVMLLQREVLTVQDYLMQIEQAQDSAGGNGRMVALMWPAFVAACEALLPETQRYFSRWFEDLLAKTGLVSVSLAKGVCEFIWARRREQDGLSWPEVLRNKWVKVLYT